MKIPKISKSLIICIVLCSSLLTACDNNSGAVLSLIRLEQSGLEAIFPAQQSNPNSSMWANMSQHFELKDQTTKAAVNTQIASLQKHQGDLYKILQNSAPYISYVFEQTQKRGLPAELALLPIVESDFNPNCRSNKGASGIWQIMPGTASDLGLKNNHAYDGRRDIVASTDAALTYLNELNRNFDGDWELALAAYNWGPGNIQKVARQQVKWFKKSNFWSLHRLPAETAEYVPKLLALAAVIKDPARYNIKLPPALSGPHLASIQVGASVDLKKIAKSTNIDVKTMRQLNPGYRNMATAAGAPNTLLVPIEKAQAFKPLVTTTSKLATNTNTKHKLASGKTNSDITTAENSRNMMKAILTQGQWLLIALADIPSINNTIQS